MRVTFPLPPLLVAGATLGGVFGPFAVGVPTDSRCGTGSAGARQGRPGQQAGSGSCQDVDRRPTAAGVVEVVTLNAWCRQADGAEIDCPRTSRAAGSARCGRYNVPNGSTR